MRFTKGRYVIFRLAHDGKRFFTGRFDRFGFPRETFDIDKALRFLSAAHGYKFGGEHPSLQEWRVKRINISN